MELPDSLQDKLEEYNRNFEALNGLLGDSKLLEAESTKELRTEKTKEILAEALPVAVGTMIDLAANAESESVRYKAAQFLISTSLGKDPAITADDPALELIKRLQRSESSDES